MMSRCHSSNERAHPFFTQAMLKTVLLANSQFSKYIRVPHGIVVFVEVNKGPMHTEENEQSNPAPDRNVELQWSLPSVFAAGIPFVVILEHIRFKYFGLRVGACWSLNHAISNQERCGFSTEATTSTNAARLHLRRFLMSVDIHQPIRWPPE